MKSILRIVLFATIMAFAATCWAGPQLQADQQKIEFGTMPEGPPAQKVVKITNVGDEPVTITNVSTSCACTNCKYEKSELAPGESVDLEVVYTTFKFIGKFEKFVWIETKEIPEKYEIMLVGDVTPMPMGVLEVKPRKVSVGDVKVGAETAAVIPVKNVGDAVMHITKAMSSKSKTVFFDAEKSEKIAIAPGETKDVPVTVTPKKAGRYMDFVMLHSDARNVTKKGYKVVVAGKGI